MKDTITLQFATGVCKVFTIKEYENMTKELDYEILVDMIEEIQAILNSNIKKDREIVEQIIDVFIKRNIYYK